MELCGLKCGESAVITAIDYAGRDLRRMHRLGITEGARITAAFRGFGKHLAAYYIKGVIIALRRSDSERIICEKTEST